MFLFNRTQNLVLSDIVNVGNVSGKIKLSEILNKMWTQNSIHTDISQ